MAASPVVVDGLLKWFRTSPYAQHYKEEIESFDMMIDAIDEIEQRCPAAGDVCQEIHNRWNLAFYNMLLDEHKQFVDANLPAVLMKKRPLE